MDTGAVVKFAYLAGVVALIAGGLFVYPAPDDALALPDTIVVKFVNDTGQEVNDLHVEFNVSMNSSIVAHQAGVPFAVSEPDGMSVHFSQGTLQDGQDTTWSFTADVPSGSLTVVSAVWTYDGEVVGAATFEVVD